MMKVGETVTKVYKSYGTTVSQKSKEKYKTRQHIMLYYAVFRTEHKQKTETLGVYIYPLWLHWVDFFLPRIIKYYVDTPPVLVSCSEL